MVAEERFQAGEKYADEEEEAYTLEDPTTFAHGLVKELASVRKQVSLVDVISIIHTLKEKPLDDRKGTTEQLIAILTSLSSKSKARKVLTTKFIDGLWNNLQHPPLSYVGGDVKYDVVSGGSGSSSAAPKPTDTIEFTVPGFPDITLREQVPKLPGGLYQYRTPDGSHNNITAPDLGRAGTPYAKTVRSTKRLHGVKPDPGLLFDLLMARDDKYVEENPAGISSMFYYHASIIIHDIFRTSRVDPNISDTSSYLDLAPLYGSSLKDQLEIRTMKGGMLKPDTFHEKRLLGQPAGVNVMLVMYSRFHNYVCDVLLKINEGGRFTLGCGPDASPEEQAKAIAKQDHNLFNTARLIVGGLYINIALHDYLRAITNTHAAQSDWTLDPRADGPSKQFDPEGTPKGVGNQVSVEFNLLYRFHSCISKKDERWINDFFLKLFPGRKPEDLQDVSWVELGQALLTFEQGIPKDPSARTFNGLERQPDGRFRDEDLVKILKEAMDDPCCVFGARTIPKALKIVEILGIKQARKWQVASLNEFRDFFGLKRYDTFAEINPDPEIAGVLEQLYTDPDMVELYPGLMIETAKPARSPGCGIRPPYTMGRAILSDAITLVRSDRFNTLDFSVANLTSWGYSEIQPDPKTLGGSMLYKLIQRALPGWFPFNSVALMQPMYTKKANERIAKELGTIDQYNTADDPKPPAKPVVILSGAAIKQVLGDPKTFAVPWAAPFRAMFPRKDLSWFMLAGDAPQNYQHRADMEAAFSKLPNLAKALRACIQTVGADLIKKATFKLRDGLHQVDFIRDVAVPLVARVLGDLFYLDLRSEENPGGSLGAAELYSLLLDIRIWGINFGSDPAQAWNRRRRAQESCQKIIDSTRRLVDGVTRSRGFGLGIASAIASAFSHIKRGSLRECGHKLVEELLAAGNSAEKVVDILWLSAFGGTGVLPTTIYEILEFFLRPDNAAIWAEVQGLAQKGDNDAAIAAYVSEAQRITSALRNVRVATQSTTVEGKAIQPGNVVVLMIGEAGRSPADIANPTKFDPNRSSSAKPDPDQLTPFSYGKHRCFGRDHAQAFLVGMVKLAATLKSLRPAVGEMGIVKAIRVGNDKLYLNDSWSHLTYDVSTWKLHYDGQGVGSFTGDREPTNAMDLGTYYNQIQKRKAEFLGTEPQGK
ncbi:linoleate diol synthase [Podospora didyma]|uniref:linoleate 8R-lipoxygenase n=1 Tax=Podospora didyma TaxID=330526 RepID=A0AAE0P842_9PEZI|nr:linoleate diol synthase [Podospora didyma]